MATHSPLRFRIFDGARELFRLVPQYSRNGQILSDKWALPGQRTASTESLKSLCSRRGWQWALIEQK